jgi:hypothetical protein
MGEVIGDVAESYWDTSIWEVLVRDRVGFVMKGIDRG